MQLPQVQQLQTGKITPIKVDKENSVGPFISVEGDYIHILVFFHYKVSKKAIEKSIEITNEEVTFKLDSGDGSHTESTEQYLWLILIRRPINWSKGKQIKFEVDFNEGDGDPRRGTKVIITD